MAPEEAFEGPFQPKDAYGRAVKFATMTGGAGAFISTVQNTLMRQNIGPMGVVSRFGSTIAVFAAMGGVFEFAKCASANLREKEDTYNSTIGGFLAGSVLGLRVRSAPAILGYGAATAIALSAFSFTGGRLGGLTRDKDVDEVSRKEEIRKNRRRPLEETINEIGEGRGIYGPGYAERRAQRIKENYGIDVPEHSKLSSTPN